MMVSVKTFRLQGLIVNTIYNTVYTLIHMLILGLDLLDYILEAVHANGTNSLANIILHCIITSGLS